MNGENTPRRAAEHTPALRATPRKRGIVRAHTRPKSPLVREIMPARTQPESPPEGGTVSARTQPESPLERGARRVGCVEEVYA